MFTGPHDDVFVAESALWLSAPLFLHFAASPRGVSPFGIELLQQQVEEEEAKVSNFYASFHLAKPSQSAKIALCVQIPHHLMEHTGWRTS